MNCQNERRHELLIRTLQLAREAIIADLFKQPKRNGTNFRLRLTNFRLRLVGEKPLQRVPLVGDGQKPNSQNVFFSLENATSGPNLAVAGP